MPSKYRIQANQAIYFISFATVAWVDVFTRPVYKEVLVKSLKYCQANKGLVLYAWCIMTNHVHLIASASEGHHLSNILRDFKKYTSKQLLRLIDNGFEGRRAWMLKIFKAAGQRNSNNKTYQLWQQDNRPKELDSNYVMDQKLEYLHNNPVSAGIVSQPSDYVYSSARNYSGENGLIEIKFIE